MTTVADFADPLGPRGKAKVAVATVVGAAIVAILGFVAFRRFESNGQLEAKLWSDLFTGEALRFFWGGLRNTLRLAAVSLALASVLAVMLAITRLSKLSPLRWVATGWLQFFRGVPLVVLMLFCYFGLDIPGFWSIVIGLTLYNSTILAEILRAGLVSLDRGQSDAAFALGMTNGQAMRMILLPQAIRRMVPALISQICVLLKDTSLGVAVLYEELLRRGQLAGAFLKNPLQSLILVAAIFLVINLLLSWVARWIERRQRHGRSKKTGGPMPPTAPDMGSGIPV